MKENLFGCTCLDLGGIWPESLTVLQLAVTPVIASPLGLEVATSDTIWICYPGPILVVLVYLARPHRDAGSPVCGVYETIENSLYTITQLVIIDGLYKKYGYVRTKSFEYHPLDAKGVMVLVSAEPKGQHVVRGAREGEWVGDLRKSTSTTLNLELTVF